MARWILILGLALGFSLRDYQVDRSAPLGGRAAAPDTHIMDGSDPFPPF